MISLCGGRAGIAFFWGCESFAFRAKPYIRFLGAVSVLYEGSSIYVSGDVWVPCWCFTVVRGGTKESAFRSPHPKKNEKSLYVQKNIYLCILKALYKKSKQY